MIIYIFLMIALICLVRIIEKEKIEEGTTKDNSKSKLKISEILIIVLEIIGIIYIYAVFDIKSIIQFWKKGE